MTRKKPPAVLFSVCLSVPVAPTLWSGSRLERRDLMGPEVVTTEGPTVQVPREAIM